MSKHMYFRFMCTAHHLTEGFVRPDVREVACKSPGCQAVATRIISAPTIALDGASGDFPTAAAQWEKNRESHMKKERKNKENHGTYK